MLMVPTWSPGVQTFLGEQDARGGDSLDNFCFTDNSARIT